MAASIQTTVTLTPGRQEFLIDTPPQGARGVQFNVANGTWAAGASAVIEVFFSYDGGATFPDGISMVTRSIDPARPLTVGFKHTAAQQAIDGVGLVIPTNARGAVAFAALAAAAGVALSMTWL